jgi:cytoskeletal protein CcmA (bactofilin family)
VASGAPDITTVAKGCTIEGSITATGDILIHGSFEGEIGGAARLVIADSGKVKAQLRARSIVVAGAVEGDVFAQDKIELKPSANLLGNITAPKILIQEGATFEGQVFMKAPGSGPAASSGKGSKDTRPIPKDTTAQSPDPDPGDPRADSPKAGSSLESRPEPKADSKANGAGEGKGEGKDYGKAVKGMGGSGPGSGKGAKG